MNHYAINYPCGVACHANTGKRYGTYYRFASKTTRDKWVERGNPLRTQRGYREAIPASDSELRALIRIAQDPYAFDEIMDGDQEIAMQAEADQEWEAEVKRHTATT
jgi:hypothetical protein